MANAICPKPIRGRRMRVTRIDGCGRPVYGPCSQVTSSGFVTVNIGAETNDSDDITVENAAGDICISVPGKSEITSYTVQIDFCAVDPDLVGIMNPGWTVLRDDAGQAIGWEETGRLVTDNGYALEVWMDHYGGETNTCQGDAAQGMWVYMLLPWVVGGVPGDLEITNGAVTFQFNGNTKRGSQWGQGPYLVELVNGIPSRLRTPVDPTSPRRVMVTTIQPPEPECGCQEVIRPIPTPADLYITGVAGESPRMTVRLRVDNHGFGPVNIDWGDGTTTEGARDGSTTNHTYATEGTYTITVSDAQTPMIVSTRDVTIPLPPDEPTLTVTADTSDPTGRTVLLAVDNHGNGPVTVDWGDGTTPLPVDNPDGQTTYGHQYLGAGIYTITVVDNDEPSRSSRMPVVVPVAALPIYTVGAGVGANDVVVTGDDANNPAGSPARTFIVDFGDNSGRITTRLNSADTVPHTYASAGNYTITVTDVASPLASKKTPVTVPIGSDKPGEPGQPTLTWGDEPGAPGAPTLTFQ